MARVCLIVDNPLRDLDGLVLLARTLALRGVDAFLVPMYTQAFDVAQIKPDLVVANYVRHNNRDLLKEYRLRGIRVAVLDTEGAGGRNADEFAELVRRGGAPGMVDLYCVWGQAQFEALCPIFGPVAKLTGCPRYDFCAPSLRPALRVPPVAPGFILINTNFPAVNPRFSSGTANERKVALKVGFEAGYAERYLEAATATLEEIVALTGTLAERFPERQFVLRPHPFENKEAYRSLEDLPNVSVRQDGASLDWVAASSMLIHLNCSTAVEAVMLDKEPVSPAWLDRQVLHIPGPSSVSLHPRTPEDLFALIQRIAAGEALPTGDECRRAREEVIRASYLAIDGRASERVADAVIACLDGVSPGGPLPSPGRRVRAIGLVQRLLGRSAWYGLVDLVSQRAARRRREAKGFTLEAAKEVLARLSAADGLALPRAELAAPRSSFEGAAVAVLSVK